MRKLSLENLSSLLLLADRRVAAVIVVGICLVAGGLAGTMLGFLGPLLTAAAIIGGIGAVLMLRDVQWGFYAVVTVSALLPFGALPFSIGFTPTFLDVALAALFFVWLMQLITRQQQDFVASPLAVPVVAFMVLAVVAFVAGLAHAPLTSFVLRHFAEILLGIAMFFATINTVRTLDQAERIIRVLIVAGFAAAVIGIVLYLLPREWSIRLLSSLGRFGYPTGGGVLRFINDDPELPMRAVATSVDPNTLGGLFILVGALMAPQFFSKKPLFRRRWVALMFGTLGLCLFLTFSRGSMGGLVAALVLLGVLRYRKLLLLLLAVAIIVLLIPQTQDYLLHFAAGLAIQDRATQMRAGEYKDALIVISRYPLLGVGFAGTPESDIYLGVANLYLTIAEEMGLVGLAAFLIAAGSFFAFAWQAWRRIQAEGGSDRRETLLLGLAAAVAGAMVGGMLDHYLFNLEFPHAVSLFWMLIGLAVSVAQMPMEKDSSA
jgi:O-antigen ligase